MSRRRNDAVPLVFALLVPATCVLKGNGRVACWGLGPSQWLPPLPGFERRTDGASPVEIEGITDAKALVQGPGPWQACATLARGELVCFTAGKFAYPEALADKGRDYLPRTVLGVRDVVASVPVQGGALAVHRGVSRFLAITTDGSVWKFRIDPVSDGPVPSGTTATVDPSLAGTKAVTHRGGGCFFRGNGVDCNRDFDLPPSAPVGEVARYHMDISDVVSLEAIGNVCAIRKDRRIACWGKNFGGRLGAPDRDRSSVLVKVELPADHAR